MTATSPVAAPILDTHCRMLGSISFSDLLNAMLQSLQVELYPLLKGKLPPQLHQDRPAAPSVLLYWVCLLTMCAISHALHKIH
ncbi:hypothetical protein [Chromobacterium sp. CV08]|uniref:hypothetical protein n=1 Tax=Chromobacterium sp. CV08 TaxID=3133274 RepID=UPI003DA949B2